MVAKKVTTKKTEDKQDKKPLNDNQTKWWNYIKDLEVNYYGLDQTVKGICEPINVVEDSLFLSPSGPAVISTLDDLLNEKRHSVVAASGEKIPKFIVEAMNKNIISLKPNPEVELKDYK